MTVEFMKLLNGDEIIAEVVSETETSMSMLWPYKFVYATHPITGLQYTNIVRWLPSKDLMETETVLNKSMIVVRKLSSFFFEEFYTKIVEESKKEKSNPTDLMEDMGMDGEFDDGEWDDEDDNSEEEQSIAKRLLH